MTIYEAFMNDFPYGFLLVDGNGRICYANPRAKQEFEGTASLLVGEPIENIISRIDHNLLRTEGAFEGKVNFRAQGTLISFGIECYPVKLPEGTYTGVVLTKVIDRSARSREEIRKLKMQSTGVLAGGIAHDFNNLLTGILGYASFLKRSLPEESKLSRYAHVIEDSATKAAKLTGQLLNFVRDGRKPLGKVNLNALLTEVLFLLKESMEDITVKMDLDERIRPVRGDESELQQVFLNLFVNARDAMQGQGLLKVTTRKQSGEEFAVIEIKDTGSGINEEVKQKMFEPFFSTKDGDGLGIGLYIVQRVVKSYSGTIEVESRKGEGTTFTISLPLKTEVTGNIIRDVRKGDYGFKKRKVLVVDDEQIVRDLLRGILEPNGYEVLEAPNGRSALELHEMHKATINVIILDMIMPGMKGDSVLNALEDRSDQTKIVISSGFMNEDQRERLEAFKIDALLNKPYRDKDVLQVMASLFPGNGDS